MVERTAAARPGGEDAVHELIQHIRGKAEISPRLTAVRVGDEAVAYGRLDQAVGEYEDVLAEHGMSDEAAMIAAVVHCIPGIGAVPDPIQQARMVNEVLSWLGRDLGDGGSVTRLRAVS